MDCTAAIWVSPISMHFLWEIKRGEKYSILSQGGIINAVGQFKSGINKFWNSSKRRILFILIGLMVLCLGLLFFMFTNLVLEESQNKKK